MSIHEGHRERLKKRFREEGLASFEDHIALELLLFYARPQVNTNETAHHLLERFQSLNSVFDAPYGELLKVQGVGENTATLIKLIPQLSRRYQISKTEANAILSTAVERGEYITPFFIGATNEQFYLICMDGKNKVINCLKLFEGSISAVQIIKRKVMEMIIGVNTTAVVIAHNHPNGVALPSRVDMNTTREIKEMLNAVSVRLIDHIIVADGEFTSMKESGFSFE